MSISDEMNAMHAAALEKGKTLIEWAVHPNDKCEIDTSILWDGNTAVGDMYLDVPLREDPEQPEGTPLLISG